MSSAQIESWLNRDDDYNEGLSLYLRFGTNEFLKNLFAGGETTYNRNRLRKELLQLSDIASDANNIAPEANKLTQNINSITDEEYSRLPTAGIVLQKQWKEWYKEMNALRHQLPNPMTEQVRHEMALKIIDLDHKVREAWDKLDYWRKYGELPAEVNILDHLKSMREVDLVKRKNNLATYISKFSKDDSKADKLSAWKQEVLQIEQILNGSLQV
ncbi:MAG TPA: hypothetical protein PKD91_01950 [Bacteroidia bacterium]|nr:hypothetical protein [Bacteroidia bacterium]